MKIYLPRPIPEWEGDSAHTPPPHRGRRIPKQKLPNQCQIASYAPVTPNASLRFQLLVRNVRLLNKSKFYMAFNSLFGKIGRNAPQAVLFALIKSKCLPALYYSLEACPVNKSQIRSLEYVLNNTFRKIFATKSFDVTTECVLYFWVCSSGDTL